MKPNIALADKSLNEIRALLNALLSDEYVLYTQTRNCHWNVTGAQFNDLHKFFQAQYEELDAIVDDTAERVRALGGKAFGTLAEFSAHARLKETPGAALKAPAMLKRLLASHEEVIRRLRADVETCARLGDAGTSDFLTGLMEQHEKMAWMLRAFLE